MPKPKVIRKYEVIGKYDVPAVGRVELVHDPNSVESGPYYGMIYEEEGIGVDQVAEHSQNEEEVRSRVSVIVKGRLELKKSKLENKLTPINCALLRMRCQQNEANALDDFEVKE